MEIDKQKIEKIILNSFVQKYALTSSCDNDTKFLSSKINNISVKFSKSENIFMGNLFYENTIVQSFFVLCGEKIINITLVDNSGNIYCTIKFEQLINNDCFLVSIDYSASNEIYGTNNNVFVGTYSINDAVEETLNLINSNIPIMKQEDIVKK